MKKILLIEDHPEIRENTAEILQLAGYEVSSAENGKIGIEMARANQPDLIICDIMMPILDGFGVLHVLQRDRNLQHVPFIFLTAKSDRADQRKAMELGADDFVTKPFTEMELLSAIEIRISKATSLVASHGQARLGGEKERMAWSQKLFSTPRTKRFSVKKKNTIFQEGNLAQQLVLVEKGIVKSFSTNSFGKILISDLYLKNEMVGIADVLLNQAFSTSAEAVSDCELAVISQHDFQEYLDQHPKEAEMISTFLAFDLIQKQKQLLDMAYTPMRERVENLIHHLEMRLENNHAPEINHCFTREELAQMAGTATESLIRVLAGKQ